MGSIPTGGTFHLWWNMTRHDFVELLRMESQVLKGDLCASPQLLPGEYDRGYYDDFADCIQVGSRGEALCLWLDENQLYSDWGLQWLVIQFQGLWYDCDTFEGVARVEQLERVQRFLRIEKGRLVAKKGP